jgi:predicted RNA-binding Zn-ribbon protein involved in translation (DUF1610 family)
MTNCTIICGDALTEHRFGPKRGYHYSPEVVARRKNTQAQLKDILVCRRCGWSWMRTELRITQPCPKCGQATDTRKNRGSRDGLKKLQAWVKQNPKKAHVSAKKGRDLMRRAAMMLVGKGDVICSGCGCDEYRALEINHINGGGTAEQGRKRSTLYRRIVYRIRETDDLNLLCRVCNARHYLELVLGPLPFDIRLNRHD